MNRSCVQNFKRALMGHRSIYAFILSCTFLIFSACQGTKKGISTDDYTASLKAKALLRIEALNERKFEPLGQLYHSEYQGWRPDNKITSVDALVQKIQKNYSGNDLMIRAEILEMEAGATIGYILFSWKMYERSNPNEIIVDQKNLEVWQRDKRLGWQLKRSLFY